MSGRKNKIHIFVTGAFLFLFITACGVVTETMDMQEAIVQGMIASPGVAAQAPSFNLVTVARNDMVRQVDFAVNARFSRVYPLTFAQSGGTFSGILYGAAGTRLYGGELLARQYFSPTVFQEIEHEQLINQISNFNQQTANARNIHHQNIAAARWDVAAANPNDAIRLTLHLRQLELRYAQFLANSEASREQLMERLAQMEASMVTAYLYAPADKLITQVSAAVAGSAVLENQWFFQVADESHIVFTVSALPDVVRFGNRFTVHDTVSDLYFDAYVASDPLLTGIRAVGMDFVLAPVDEVALRASMEALNISPFQLVTQSNLRITSTTVLAYHALILPNRAIRTEDRRLYVYVYENGHLLKRYITRGLQHQGYAEILMGLYEGQQVAVL